jgi:hypothetical protein
MAVARNRLASTWIKAPLLDGGLRSFRSLDEVIRRYCSKRAGVLTGKEIPNSKVPPMFNDEAFLSSR